MHRIAVTVLLLAVCHSMSSAAERRCGWIDNPTPGNRWLHDRDGEWTMNVQGGHQVDGPDDLNLRPREMVETNGSYGYGCMCVTAVTDWRTMTVKRVIAATPLPLRRCRIDPALRGVETRLRGGG